MASKSIQNIDILNFVQIMFKRWNCFIDWSKDMKNLWKRLAYYNRVNHFSVSSPLDQQTFK